MPRAITVFVFGYWLWASSAAVFGDDVTPGKVIFAANPRGHWELFQYRPGQEPLKLTNQTQDARTPALSPDSTQLAYTTSDGSLWVLFLKTGTLKHLGARFSNGQYGFPTWVSEDTVAYTTYIVTPPTEDSDIFAYSFKDHRQRILLSQTGPQDFSSVSPSGAAIAFMSSSASLVAGFGATITEHLWVASLRTGAVEQLTSGSSRDTRPTWSPDEKMVAFSSDRQGGPQIWTIDVASRALAQLTTEPGENTDPCWSPDGRSILFVSTATGRRALRLIDVKTHRISTLRPFGAKDVEVRDPAWGK